MGTRSSKMAGRGVLGAKARGKIPKLRDWYVGSLSTRSC